MRCLIVEDDTSTLDLMERLLQRGGHRVHSETTLVGAQAALARVAFDVVLLDLELPDGAGADVVRAVRSLAPHSRLLVVSGYSDSRHAIGALDEGADGYLLKDELHVRLSDALQEVRAGHAPISAPIAAIALRRLRERKVQLSSGLASTLPAPLPGGAKRG